MENINRAIEYAMNAQPVEFKDAIGSALADKIADAVQLRKIEIGGSLLKDTEDSPQSKDNFKLEDNLDEEL